MNRFSYLDNLKGFESPNILLFVGEPNNFQWAHPLVRISSYSPQKILSWVMALNWIHNWSSGSGALWKVLTSSKSFLPGRLWPGVVLPPTGSSISQIYLRIFSLWWEYANLITVHTKSYYYIELAVSSHALLWLSLFKWEKKKKMHASNMFNFPILVDTQYFWLFQFLCK